MKKDTTMADSIVTPKELLRDRRFSRRAHSRPSVHAQRLPGGITHDAAIPVHWKL